MKKVLSLVLTLILALSICCVPLTTSASELILGDLNDDGTVNIVDMLLLRKRLARVIGNSDINKAAADINTDGNIDQIDAQILMMHLSKERLLSTNKTYTFDSICENGKVLSRGVVRETNLLLSQTASGVEFYAECEGNLVINLTSSASAKLNITVDDDLDNSYELNVTKNSTKYTARLNLEKGKHKIAIQKATEWLRCDLITLSSITITGSVLDEKIADKPLKFEFYGDSITSGYGNLTSQSGAGEWNFQNGCKTYATYVSRLLGADYAIASASGHGILGGYSNTTDTYKKYFDYSLIPDKTPWSRADYNADLIVINLGTNDNSRAGSNLDKTVFVAECSKIVEGMHEENPDVKILWVIGMNYVSDSMPIISALKELDQKYDYVNFYKSVAAQNGGDSHPNINNHKSLAEKLGEYIKQNYPEFF